MIICFSVQVKLVVLEQDVYGYSITKHEYIAE